MPREGRVRGGRQLDLTTSDAMSFYWGGFVRARRVNERRRDSMSTRQTNRLFVQAIDAIRLDAVRITGADGHANKLRPFAATAKASRCFVAFATPSQASRSR